MPTAGTLTAKVTADASGLAPGFARAKREAQQFERQFTSSTRSMGSAFQNLAVDLAVSGAAGQREMKRIVESGLQMAMVFGPTGAVLGAVGLTLTSMVSGFARAREEAEKAQKQFEDTLKAIEKRHDVAGASDIAVEKFAALRAAEGKLTKLQANRDTLKAQLPDLGQAGAMEFSRVARQVEAQEKLVASLKKQHTQAKSVADSAAAYATGMDLSAASVDRWRESLRRAADEAERLGKLRAEGPAFRLAVGDARIAAQAAQSAAVADVNRVTGVAGKLDPKVAGISEAMRDIDRFAAGLTSEAGQLQQSFNMIRAGAMDTAAALQQGLKNAAMNLAQTMIMIGASLGSQLAGGGIGAGLGGAFGGAIGGALGAAKLRWSMFGVGLGGPIGGILGGIAGGLLGKAVGGLVKGIGRVFGFGKKKRGPSPEELAAQRLQDLAKAAREASEQLLNVARGFKVAFARFMASDPRVPQVPRGEPSEPGRPGGKGRDGAAKQGATFANYGTITVVANNPQEFLDQLTRGGFTTNRGGVRGYQLALTPSR